MLPESEYDRYRKICLNGLTNPDILQDWDRKFLVDYTDKFEKHRRHTYVSDKQAEQFDRIEEYLKKELGHDYDD